MWTPSAIAEDFAAAGDELKGAIAMCNRGEINFTAKGNNAVAAGAIGTIVGQQRGGHHQYVHLTGYTEHRSLRLPADV